MYNELINILGIEPFEDPIGFILCIFFVIFFIDKCWLFLYSLFRR